MRQVTCDRCKKDCSQQARWLKTDQSTLIDLCMDCMEVLFTWVWKETGEAAGKAPRVAPGPIADFLLHDGQELVDPKTGSINVTGKGPLRKFRTEKLESATNEPVQSAHNEPIFECPTTEDKTGKHCMVKGPHTFHVFV